MRLTDEEVLRLLRIVDGVGYGEIRLQFGDLKLHVITAHPRAGAASTGSFAHRTMVAGGPAEQALEAIPTLGQHRESPPSAARPVEINGASHHTVRAPFAGTFYRGPRPGASPFVTLEQIVDVDDPVCLVEIMKLFQSVAASRRGRVVAILVEDGTAVAEGQALFAIEED